MPTAATPISWLKVCLPPRTRPGRLMAVLSLTFRLVGVDGKNPAGITAPASSNYAPAWQPLPPPPNSTPTPTLTNTPVATPIPPSPTSGGTSLLLDNQDVCTLKDGIGLAVPLKFFNAKKGGLLPAGYVPGTFVATPGVEITATATMSGYGIIGLAFIREDIANAVGVADPEAGQALYPGFIGNGAQPLS